MTEKSIRHYFKDNERKSIKVTIRFTPDEMKLIDGVMESLGRDDKARFLHNTMMSSLCRVREELIKVGQWKENMEN